MSKRHSSAARLWSGALLLAALLSVPRSASAEEMLAKYDFEGVPAFLPNWGAGYQGQYKPATGWKEPFVVGLDKGDPHSGDACLRIEIQAGAGTIRVHSPGITAPPEAAGTTVQVHAFVRAEGLAPDSAAVGLLEHDAQGKSIGYVGGKEKLVNLEPSQSWQEVSFEGAMNSQTKSVTFMITIQAQTAPAVLWLDDLSLEWKPGT